MVTRDELKKQLDEIVKKIDEEKSTSEEYEQKEEKHREALKRLKFRNKQDDQEPISYTEEDIEDSDAPKRRNPVNIAGWLIFILVISISIYMWTNFTIFFMQLGDQTLGSALVSFLIIMILWNLASSFLLIFGARDAIQNIKMFFLRRAGYGYSILLDRDRGIKKFVSKLNRKNIKIGNTLYKTDRRKLRLWEGRIPSYIFEAGYIEPSSAGLTDKETPIDSEEYQTTVELAELAGKIKAKKDTKWVLFAVLATLFITLFIAFSINNLAEKSDIQIVYLQQIFDLLKNTTGTVKVVI